MYVIETLMRCDMFAYCNNNRIMCYVAKYG